MLVQNFQKIENRSLEISCQVVSLSFLLMPSDMDVQLDQMNIAKQDIVQTAQLVSSKTNKANEKDNIPLNPCK